MQRLCWKSWLLVYTWELEHLWTSLPFLTHRKFLCGRWRCMNMFTITSIVLHGATLLYYFWCISPLFTDLFSIIRNRFGFCITFTEECVPAYSYRHLLSLTSNTTMFQVQHTHSLHYTTIQSISCSQGVLNKHLNISVGADSPEGGFDALLQATVCTEVCSLNTVTHMK